MRDYIEEKIEEVKNKIKEYESKTYTIKNGSSIIINDEREYNQLIGEKRSLEMMLNLLRNE
ncbi:hypothetical protein [Clostridium botulinum]|uniref:hypothetical protein n=1 Tax=Clostridium botulinum TaxID=1491 RepID=UPI001C9B167E|nr:hypothetical protein [Clostridium botulinum]MBY6842841.1 hypothetical protein [Clostridium botulinum]